MFLILGGGPQEPLNSHYEAVLDALPDEAVDGVAGVASMCETVPSISQVRSKDNCIENIIDWNWKCVIINPNRTKYYKLPLEIMWKLVQVRLHHRYRAYTGTESLAGQRHSRSLAGVVKGLVCEGSRVRFRGEPPLLMVSVSTEIG